MYLNLQGPAYSPSDPSVDYKTYLEKARCGCAVLSQMTAREAVHTFDTVQLN